MFTAICDSEKLINREFNRLTGYEWLTVYYRVKTIETARWDLVKSDCDRLIEGGDRITRCCSIQLQLYNQSNLSL